MHLVKVIVINRSGQLLVELRGVKPLLSFVFSAQRILDIDILPNKRGVLVKFEGLDSLGGCILNPHFEHFGISSGRMFNI